MHTRIHTWVNLSIIHIYIYIHMYKQVLSNRKFFIRKLHDHGALWLFANLLLLNYFYIFIFLTYLQICESRHCLRRRLRDTWKLACFVARVSTSEDSLFCAIWMCSLLLLLILKLPKSNYSSSSLWSINEYYVSEKPHPERMMETSAKYQVIR